MKTPISYYGGKQTMLRHILPLIPAHITYTEAFCGGAAVFFAKEPSELEIINDINGNLINFYRVLKTDFNDLQKKISATLHSRRDHDYACIVYEYPEYFDNITRAWALWVLSKQSFASKLDGVWGYDKAKNSVAKKIDNARNDFTASLSIRLSRTQIECTDALRIIKTRDSINTFHFVDTPYINSDCGHYKGYLLSDFEALISLLETLDGKFMLTMFPHDLLASKVKENGWTIHSIERNISASKTSRRRQEEWIICNYKINDLLLFML